MIDLEIVDAEIDRLEMMPTSFYACRRLSTLYNVRDHLTAKIHPPEGKADLKSSLGGSDFLDAANGKPYEDVMKIVDEHMETVLLLYPKTYETLVQRIREL